MKTSRVVGVVCAAVCLAVVLPFGAAADDELPVYLKDRGRGITTSLFGTYVEKGQLLVYPFYEYEKNSQEEYHGSELGYKGSKDYDGELTKHQALLFLAYGFTEDLALELEGALYEQAKLKRATDDTTSGLPNELKESGLSTIEANARYRLTHETQTAPEWFCNLEAEFPFQKDKVLIGAQHWEVGAGLGAVKGFSWGTLTPRVSLVYEGDEQQVKIGEYALEYLKRVSKEWRMVATVEGEAEDLSLIGEAQWHFSPDAFLKLNCGFGVAGTAPDVAPEVGVMFIF